MFENAQICYQSEFPIQGMIFLNNNSTIIQGYYGIPFACVLIGIFQMATSLLKYSLGITQKTFRCIPLKMGSHWQSNSAIGHSLQR